MHLFFSVLFFLTSCFLMGEHPQERKTICLNMIVKNERAVIEECLASVKNFIDYWVIVDTGSTDGTQAAIQEFLKDVPGELHERPWINFAHNRNEALALAKTKADYTLFIDADERWALSPGFQLPPLDKDCYRIVIREIGVVDSLRKCLINNRLNWQWVGVLHEVLLSSEAQTYQDLEGVINLNNTAIGARSKNPQKYLKDAQILEEALQIEPDNSRYVFYLAQSYGNAREFALAINYFQKRIAMGTKDPEVFWSLYAIGKCQERLELPIETILASYGEAHRHFPDRAEPLYRIGEIYFNKGNYLLSYLTSQYALSLPRTQEKNFIEPWVYDWGLWQQYANSAYHLGRYEDARVAAKKLLANPQLPSALRTTFENNLLFLEQKAPAKKIGIYTFPVAGVPPWDPHSIESGITGSEEAVIYMSQQLANLGYQVTVFGNPPLGSPFSKKESNPRFIPLDLQEQGMFDIAIAWRAPKMGKMLKKKAHLVYLWPHDLFSGKLSREEIDSFDDVLWVSKWQREQWTSVNPQMARFTHIFGNGVNPEQFSPITERANPYACIYASNYGQGLDVLLNIWPQIKEKFPQATLDIYYGWKHWGMLSPEKETFIRSRLEQLKTSGVQEHGQVGHQELNQAYAQASFWTYPCTGTETFCITGLRAQLSGAIPVIIDGSGLRETVRSDYKCKCAEEYFSLLVKAMQEAENISLEKRKQTGDSVKKEFTWQAIAAKWHRLFQKNSSLKQPGG